MTAPIDYSIYDICSIIDGSWLSKNENTRLEYISLDSRKIPDAANTLFWALSTGQRDAAAFISELYKNGVRNFVTETAPDKNVLQGSNVIIVKNTLKALQLLAISHRKKFQKIKVIGITGSNGKTIVKEWLSELLSKDHTVIKSPRSFNSQIGVPLSILQIREHHTIGIFEAGISKPGEMAELEKMILPGIGVLTNIGSAHDEGFKNKAQKIQEKLLLFKAADTIVFPNQQQIRKEIEKLNYDSGKKLFDWGKIDSTYRYNTKKQIHDAADITISSHENTQNICIPFTDSASIENAVSVFVTMDALGVVSNDSLKRFQSISSVNMRLEMKPGIHQCSIINDSYSNDLQSLSVAIDFLNKQKHKSHSLILSDIVGSGLPPNQLYKRVATLLHGKKIDRFIGIGNEIQKEKQLFSFIPNSTFFHDTDSFLNHISGFNFRDEAILLKGARVFEFEKISNVLEAQLHKTVLTINLNHLTDNIRCYRNFLNPGTRLMVMVKALAYGSGSNEIASLMEFIKADYLAVAYTDEGIALRDAGITLPVMVLNIEQTGFDTLIKNRLEPEIYSHELLDSFSAFLSNRKLKHYPVHIKIDSGMHRLGFVNAEITRLVEKLKKNDTLRVMSVFSHLSSADNPKHDSFTRKQFATFKKVADKLRQSLPYPFLCHISNSSAISRFPEFQMDMVRLGIGMYGIDSNPKISNQLKPVHKLTTTISQIKKVKKGEVVGYGRNILRKNKTIATVGIGYADGYPRILGNGSGKMYVQGKLAPVVGNVCMDMAMIDITGIGNAEVGDEVEIFGSHIPLQTLAQWADTIPYEIITGISTRVKRVYVEG